MPFYSLGLLAPNRYESDVLNEVLNVLIGQTVAKLKSCKVGDHKKSETVWVRGYIFRDFM